MRSYGTLAGEFTAFAGTRGGLARCDAGMVGAFVSTLAQAYAVTRDEQFAEECFVQIESWREQNPLGLGANWMCAMEVALRAMNLIGVFTLLRNSPSLTEKRLLLLLALFEQHGAHIRRNL